MKGALQPRQRVIVTAGLHAGRTAKTVRLHGGKGFAQFWLIWFEGTEWDSPLFGVPAGYLKALA